MTTTTMDLQVPQQRTAPRLAAPFAAAFATLLNALKPAERVNVEENQAAREAADVRAMARQYLKTDPGFAADLFAAADRHEELFGN
ncbi:MULTISPECIES: hypothetical protein [unclassified Rhizobacter]|uniref:hypothetical protein n=1 Tax=unclassified Rhizobacter TaxID=2640088 RepID=UPI0006FA920E|nr:MULTISPECIES: hypothetical protein [unclassified Rhizobacter]KQU78220.1 hypothetical protein ASC88_20620 [Rhizobacter sp. Root29]KQW15966.1 hypothetical protein ASC98_01840 [Rhizobacter sp. Root1238]KRB25084.1 hypothetical protein ASE08_02590 [Rhizobacter sp. Root16D2]